MSRALPPTPAAMRRDAALLLDFDGTLVEFAATPEAVRVPDDLRALLDRVSAATEGAVALITGRSLDSLDALLAPAVPIAAAEHGAILRTKRGVMRCELPEAPRAWREAAAQLVAAHPGALVEQKSRGFVVHVRRTPASLPAVRAALESLVAADPRFELMDAAMAIELRPRGVDKGTAVFALMEQPPFAGRAPVFIGDDVTDEDGMRAARALGGCGLRVAEVFENPAGVRSWLAEIAEAEDAAAA